MSSSKPRGLQVILATGTMALTGTPAQPLETDFAGDNTIYPAPTAPLQPQTQIMDTDVAGGRTAYPAPTDLLQPQTQIMDTDVGTENTIYPAPTQNQKGLSFAEKAAIATGAVGVVASGAVVAARRRRSGNNPTPQGRG